MMQLFINGWAASAGGGLTYLRNLIPQLSRTPEVACAVLLNPALRGEFDNLPNVTVVNTCEIRGALRRFVNEQTGIPSLIRRHGGQVLISTGNFAIRSSPVPQVLLSRNSLYLSADFKRDARSRGDYALWADTIVKGWLARRSIRWADATVAPSAAFAAELKQWSGRDVIAIHHGFDVDAFNADPAPLPLKTQELLQEGGDALRLLFVSHYNYYRNFETLFRTIPILKRRLEKERVKLYLTCVLDSRENPGAYQAEAAASMARELLAGRDIVELGSIPYRSLHHLYRACHIYVTPAYAESFAHPLVEAMSCGLPVAASDLAVHREICGDAALYFPRFSPERLADAVLRIHLSPDLACELREKALARSREFSWKEHTERLLALSKSLVAAG